MTDPSRTPDPVAIAAALPRGAGVIYRTFGADNAWAIAGALRRVATARGLTLLIGADEKLAAAVGADGLHLPQRSLARARLLRARRPSWLITGAAHDLRAIRMGRELGLDAMLISPVFASRSASAQTPLGPIRLARLVRQARSPIYALGGVNVVSGPRLMATGAYGLAAVDGLAGDEGGLRP